VAEDIVRVEMNLSIIFSVANFSLHNKIQRIRAVKKKTVGRTKPSNTVAGELESLYYEEKDKGTFIPRFPYKTWIQLNRAQQVFCLYTVMSFRMYSLNLILLRVRHSNA